MIKHKVQFSVFVVYLCAYGYILNTLHNLIQLPCMHEIQLAIALAYALMYYYGNTARDLTRTLSFIIISVWHFGKPKCSEILSWKIQIFKIFWGGMPSDSLFGMLCMQVCFTHY